MEQMKNFKKLIKSSDLFGYVINLQYKRGGKDHKTLIGGIFSILIKQFLCLYLALLVKNIVLNEGGTYNSYRQVFLDKLNGDTLWDAVNYNETNIQFFNVISKDLSQADPFIGTRFDQYVNISYTQVLTNFYMPIQPVQFRSVPSRNCTQDDFGYSDAAFNNFQALNGWYSLVCPDFEQDDGFILQGDDFSMVSQSIYINVNYCQNSSLNNFSCKSLEEIAEYIQDLRVDTWAQYEIVDFTVFNQKPVQQYKEVFSSICIGAVPGYFESDYIYLANNQIQTEDALFQVSQYNYWNFYSVNKVIQRYFMNDTNPGTLAQVRIYMQAQQYFHKRKIYGLLDLLGDFGGANEALVMLLGIFLFPVSEHSFIMSVIKNLFYAKTKEPNIFIKKNKEKIENIDDEEQHQNIQISFSDSALLYFSNSWWCGCLLFKCCWKKKSKLQRLYDQGQEKIYTKLDAVQILKSLRYQEDFINRQFLNDTNKYEIDHASDNIIDIDLTSEDNDQNDEQENLEENGIETDRKLLNTEKEKDINTKVYDNAKNQNENSSQLNQQTDRKMEGEKNEYKYDLKQNGKTEQKRGKESLEKNGEKGLQKYQNEIVKENQNINDKKYQESKNKDNKQKLDDKNSLAGNQEIQIQYSQQEQNETD